MEQEEQKLVKASPKDLVLAEAAERSREFEVKLREASLSRRVDAYASSMNDWARSALHLNRVLKTEEMVALRSYALRWHIKELAKGTFWFVTGVGSWIVPMVLLIYGAVAMHSGLLACLAAGLGLTEFIVFLIGVIEAPPFLEFIPNFFRYTCKNSIAKSLSFLLRGHYGRLAEGYYRSDYSEQDRKEITKMFTGRS